MLIKMPQAKVRINPDVKRTPARVYTRYCLKFQINGVHQNYTQFTSLLGLWIYKFLKYNL